MNNILSIGFKVVNYLFFYIGWAICMQQASIGNPFVGPLLVGAMLFFHLALTRPILPELVLIGSITLAGTVLDSLYINLGLLSFKTNYPGINWITPPWLTAIWVLYAMCLNHSLGWMRNLPKLIPFLGGIAAVLCYKAAETLGVVIFHYNDWITLGIIGLIWIFFFPFSLIWASLVTQKFKKK